MRSLSLHKSKQTSFDFFSLLHLNLLLKKEKLIMPQESENIYHFFFFFYIRLDLTLWKTLKGSLGGILLVQNNQTWQPHHKCASNCRQVPPKKLNHICVCGRVCLHLRCLGPWLCVDLRPHLPVTLGCLSPASTSFPRAVTSLAAPWSLESDKNRDKSDLWSSRWIW